MHLKVLRRAVSANFLQIPEYREYRWRLQPHTILPSCSSATLNSSNHSTVSTMCTTTYYESPSCRHSWLTLRDPCRPGRNFHNCFRLSDDLHDARNGLIPLHQRTAPPYCCPRCDGVSTDSRVTRMIENRGFGGGLSFFGPSYPREPRRHSGRSRRSRRRYVTEDSGVVMCSCAVM